MGNKVTEFKTNDIVLFKTKEYGFKTNIGMIIKCTGSGKYIILTECPTKVHFDIDLSWIIPVSEAENERQAIISHYDKIIASLESQIADPIEEELDSTKVAKYESLKKQILRTAKSLIDHKNNDDFENKLKSIAELKKALFRVEIDCALEVRKANKEIRWQIERNLAKRYLYLNSISDTEITRALTNL